MDINSIIDKLNNELEKLNNIKNGNNIDTNTFFTNDEKFNDDFSFDDTNIPNKTKDSANDDISINLGINSQSFEYANIEPDDETTSLVTIKERRLLTAQNMFKKSVRVSLKSFLISISLSFLNLFI